MKYVKTEIGQKALHDRSIALAPRQRAAFILLDGKRSTDEVLKATAAMGVKQEDIDHMLSLGLLAEVPGSDAAAPARASPSGSVAPPAADKAASGATAAGGSATSPQERYMRAYPIATRLTSSLGLRGFRLNLAVEAAGSLEQLQDLAPKIRDAVGAEKFEPLGQALYD